MMMLLLLAVVMVVMVVRSGSPVGINPGAGRTILLVESRPRTRSSPGRLHGHLIGVVMEER